MKNVENDPVRHFPGLAFSSPVNLVRYFYARQEVVLSAYYILILSVCLSVCQDPVPTHSLVR